MFRVKENNACLSPVFSLFEPQQVATLNPTYHLPYFTDFSGPGFSFVRCLSWILLFCLIIFVFVCVWQPLIHNSDGVLIRCSMASKLSWDRLDAITISLLVTKWKVKITRFEALFWAILARIMIWRSSANQHKGTPSCFKNYPKYKMLPSPNIDLKIWVKHKYQSNFVMWCSNCMVWSQMAVCVKKQHKDAILGKVSYKMWNLAASIYLAKIKIYIWIGVCFADSIINEIFSESNIFHPLISLRITVHNVK